MVAKKNDTPLVSIVILNWNGLEDTKLCLESVRNLDYPSYEIIVVDNGSSAAEKKYLSSLNDVVFVDNSENRGFAGGQADGLKHSKGDFILLLNNDAIIDNSFLQIAMPMFRDNKVAAVGGRSYFWNDQEDLFDTTNSYYSYMTVDPVSAETTLQTKDFGIVQEVNTISGAAAVVRRRVIDEVGYLWEPFFAYYEETDLFARMKRAGYKIVYNPKLNIWHKNGASSGSQSGSLFFYYHIFRNRYMYAVRNFDDKYLALFKKSFYIQAILALKRALRNPDHRRLAHGYLKSLVYIVGHSRSLKQQRAALKSKLLDQSYNMQLIREQIGLSIIIDATKHTQANISAFIKKLPKHVDPLHEYVLVTRDNTPTPNNLARNIRTIADKRFFETHPINLGCLIARNEWLVICSLDCVDDINNYVSNIADAYVRKKCAIDLGKGSIILSANLYRTMGGLQASNTSLVENIQTAKDYSWIKNTLLTKSPPLLEATQKDLVSELIKRDNGLIATTQHSRWSSFLSRHYQLQQLNNLAKWFLVPSISLRRKLGRVKNFVLFTATLNRRKIATELRYVREELYAEKLRKKDRAVIQHFKQESKQFEKNQLRSVANIPVFIICFERIKDLKSLVTKLEEIGIKKIVFIDNDSTYKPLIDYLSTTPYQVLSLQRNIGHTSPWELGIIRTLIPYGYYIVTDPDVLPTDACLSGKPVEHMLKIHKKYPAYQKVGFGLKIDDLPDHYPLKREVIEWEKQFWKTEIEPGIYEAGVDTTFALYKPGTFLYTLHPSLRTGEPYTARHMPWYANPEKQTEEDIHYKMRANANVTSWNVDELPERYKKEMKIKK